MKPKIWVILNISLFLGIILLLLTFFSVNLPTIGKARYYLDTSEPACVVENWQKEFVSYGDLDRCCLEARQQISCAKSSLFLGEEKQHLTEVCSSGEKGIKYWLNSKAYGYCQQLEIW